MPKVYYKNILEIACFSVEACLEAEKAGADRIEFCAEYGIGGITPKHEDILRVKKFIRKTGAGDHGIQTNQNNQRRYENFYRNH